MADKEKVTEQRNLESVEGRSGRSGLIGREEIDQARTIFREYKNAKANLENRIIENEQWWRLRHWDAVGNRKQGDPQPASAWLFNSIINKHADAMDNFPAPNFLPRERSDEQEAMRLHKIIPTILEMNNFEGVYSDAWFYKLKIGTVPYGVFWDNNKDNGLGDVVTKNLDLLNLFWEPGVKDIQESAHFFNIDAVYKDKLVEQYPELKNKLVGGVNGDVVKYISYENDNSHDDEKKVVVYDWYYKKFNSKGISVVHFCKFVEGEVLYASENDEEYKESGYYDHGLYPFEFDTLFPVEDSPVGFGYVDVMKSPQIYVDKLDQLILKNAAMAGKPRFFCSESSNVNIQDFADWSKDFVRVAGQIDDSKLKQIKVDNMPSYIVNHMQMKIDELKETSGNRDFSQGSTQSGVTAASAIAALQEAGSKLSRDMIKTSYRSYKKIVALVLEVVRQFYTEDRCFRIEGPNGEHEFLEYSNAALKPQQLGEDPVSGEPIIRKPVFDIKIQAQKQSPFSREAQNERAKELFSMGVFNPQMAVQALAMLEMMEFEGIDKIKSMIRKNDMIRQLTEQLCQMALSMAQTVDNLNMMQGMPGNMYAQVAQLVSGITGQQIELPQVGEIQDEEDRDNQGLPKTENTIALNARKRVASATTVR